MAFAVIALTASDTFAATANTLKVTPVRADVEIKAGEKKILKVTVSNITDGLVTVRPVQNDFIAGDERGTPALILDADKFAPTHSLKRFMAPLADVTIPARQSKVIDVTITVPQTAQAGGYFGAIRFAPTSPDEGGQVNLSASVASLILMRVPGPVEETLSLTDFQVQQKGKSGNYFNTPDDLQVTYRFKNDGNVQIGPMGKISVTKDKKVVYDADFNNKTPRDVILPDSARRWETGLKNIETFGNYEVTATFTYGEKNQTIEVKKSFWVIPMHLIYIAIGAVLGLILLIVGIWFFLRSYKRRILGGGGGRRRHRRRY
mgnify:CR=1 FL=1